MPIYLHIKRIMISYLSIIAPFYSANIREKNFINIKDRYNTWENSVKPLIKKIHGEIKDKLFRYDDGNIFNILIKDDNIEEVKIMRYSGCLAYTDPPNVFNKKTIVYNPGSIMFRLAQNGCISVIFKPTSTRTNAETLYQYAIDSGQIHKFKRLFFQDNGNFFPLYLYGCYEPSELTEKKLKKIIGRGLHFINDTNLTTKPTISTFWLFIKRNELYQGLFWGFLLAIPASAAWEGIKLAIEKLWNLIL